ncbi:DUF397 domain-containing protein [Actinoplanes sp. N902-109]|uniref:DUF397 domain-containing protein n=1 Tax=Actinoplanes sp. (strain N902-109) TaxID=649831 RepID=UPI000329539E|nr:DUF397 domain-containing protein [Actinoplanes sp. N902-109]AGL14000.1 putative regulatory protein [Actinoplanes sp. N902-109]
MIDSVEPVWHSSSKCAAGHCVEVAKVNGTYLIRDGKNPGATPLQFSADEWAAFQQAVIQGEFNL